MKRNFFLFVIILMSILSVVCAEGEAIEVNYPENVNFNEEFGFKIKLINFSSDIYDVKIDINPSSRIAEILDAGNWKSTYYYVNDIINAGEEKEFKLKIVKTYTGEADIEIKIRSSSDASKTFTDYSINVLASSPPEENTTTPPPDDLDTNSSAPDSNNATQSNLSSDDSDEENSDSSNSETPKLNSSPTSSITSNSVQDTQTQISSVRAEPIKLITPKDIKTEKNSENSSKDKYIMYGLAGFSTIILFLFALKFILNNRRKNEFEN